MDRKNIQLLLHNGNIKRNYNNVSIIITARKKPE
jgi:hypothetical protein